MPRLRKAGPAVSAVVAAILVLAAATTGAAAPAGLTLSGQWFRFIMASRPAAGYFTLANASATGATLTGAHSAACGTLMLHRSLRTNGVDRMVMVASVAVPAHGVVTFAPGGYHLMCLQPTAAMRHGKTVPVTLEFAGGGSLSAAFPVRNAMGR